MLLRCLRDTDYRAAKNVMHDRFGADDTNNFVEIWYTRNRKVSFCVEHHGCMLGFVLVVQNKLEYVVVHERFSCMGLGSVLVRVVLEKLQDDFKIVHLVTAENPLLRQWYMNLGFEFASPQTDRDGVTGDVMIYRFRTKRGTLRPTTN